MHHFQLAALPAAPFAALFELSDDALAHHGAQRCIAAESTGYPCRISLEDATQGDELLLLPFEHQPAASPYRASGPIFVRRGALQRVLPADQVPPYLSTRLLSVRAYDRADMIIEASVRDGTEIADEIRRLFGHPAVAYIHLHFAKRGCFACRVDRAEPQQS
ncbi:MULTISPECIES: DUF1203 domain-containing protein [unclassified Rhizobacter]|uniref:DUF1203 domain-containing protein n=1 Tax=unclassified Rhizobacter TaxID=2640088 RepID=UPI0006FB6700|nr:MULTISPECIES: DUF1203 domain-containing protein [unclassified Rhizobacter]KQU80825.1 hypothetical protein ASC88_14850 [Rhizobacter sp. Root29]KQW04368.1 hypothetical protein ASC98_04540 [Rhizobacter sp. Root1238]KRB14501.1 hypothetical protein ASE08_08600 [Rhizobacter sp. Root16D2]